ncbi:MAG TPA: hypothetical protein VGN37_06070 [Actinocatenispora sp.]
MTERRDSRVPWEFAGIAGLVGALVLGVACAAVAPGQRTGGLVAFAVLVAVLGWFTTPVGGGLVALLGWLCLTGFVVNTDGTLHATGPADLLRAGVLLAAGLGAAALHVLLRARRSAAAEEPDDDPFVPRLGAGDRRPAEVPFGVVHGMSLAPTPARRPARTRPGPTVVADPAPSVDRAPASVPAVSRDRTESRSAVPVRPGR